MNIRTIKFAAVVLLWGFLIFLVIAAYCWHWLYAPHIVSMETEDADESYIYTIDKGTSLYSVSRDLHDKGVLHWPKVWVLFARLNELTNIKKGEYELRGDESPVELLRIFNSSNVVTYDVTLVEGSQFKEFLATLHNQPKIAKKLVPGQELQQLQALGVDVEHLEGWFFPDTYKYVAGDSDIDILLRAHEKMKIVLAQEWSARAENLPYDTAYEALIMASIVEKETGVPYERDQIAGVFVRRLQKNMRLQTDPTVIYGLGEIYDGNIRRKDLRAPTPYNTYIIRGLPPTPIAMPGREAIHAALHPAEGNALYFVAKGDGTHHFSVTNEEHINAVNKYQKRRRQDYRSAPANSIINDESSIQQDAQESTEVSTEQGGP